MNEPNWISAELHDGLLPWVIGARLQLMALLANSPTETPLGERSASQDRDSLQQILQLLDQACHEGRQLIRFLDDHRDLPAIDVVALLNENCHLLLSQTSDSAPVLEFVPPKVAWPTLPPEKAWHVLRISLQAFANALFHSHGTRISVELSITAGENSGAPSLLEVRISDDGCGFDPTQQFPGHYGLSNMRRRALAAGLQLQIRSTPQGGGTQVELRFPQ